jgi:hypothetical protein
MKNEYSKGGLMVTDVECLERSLKTRQFIRAFNSNQVISKIQALVTNKNVNDNRIRFEYCNIDNEETVCSRAQSTINIITDYYRLNLTLDESNKTESENIVNYVSSSNVQSYLKRKNKLLHLCVLKPLTDLNIDTLGELTQEYEYTRDLGLSERMKIVLGAFPSNLKLILEKINENSNCNESLESINLANNNYKNIHMITTKEFQNIL